MDEQLIGVVERGRARIEEGWLRGSFGGGHAHCLVGALIVERGPEVSRAVDHFTKMLGTSPTLWNDAPWRTKEDVLAAYDALLAKLYAGQCELREED